MANDMKRDDLIRRSDVLDKVVIYPNYSENGLSVDTYVVFDDDVMTIPAVDAVEVVRCRECVNWRRYDDSPADCDMNMMRMGPEDYCSYGQRREGT